MSFQFERVLAVGLLLIGGWTAANAPRAWGQEESGRKTKYKVAPAYPALARKMGITGVVKVQVTVAPNGTVRDAKLVGGHPILANSVMDAVRKWRFDAGSETTEILAFHFSPAE